MVYEHVSQIQRQESLGGAVGREEGSNRPQAVDQDLPKEHRYVESNSDGVEEEGLVSHTASDFKRHSYKVNIERRLCEPKLTSELIADYHFSVLIVSVLTRYTRTQS